MGGAKMSSRQKLNLPKHKNPRRPDRIASAPYNFVPLPEVVVTAVESASELPDHDRYYPDRCTGYFEVTLTTMSPVYVRCPLTRQEFDLDEQNKDRNGRPIDNQTRYTDCIKNTPDFFYTRDRNQPVIPGSSLRGMLRSVLEIVSYGKVQWVMGKKLIYRAVGDASSLGDHYRKQMLGSNKAQPPNMHFDYPSSRVKAGYLRKTDTGWAIQPAREIYGETFVHVEYQKAYPIIKGRGRQLVHDVFVKPAKRAPLNRGPRGRGNLTLDLAITERVFATPDQGLVRAKLIESGHIEGKHPKHWHCAIYEPDPTQKLIPIPDDMWEIYQEDRDLTRGLPTRPLQQDGDPLFYLLDADGNLVFFGPTMMFRLPYTKRPIDLVPQELRRPEDIDYAEALFGFVRTAEELENMKQRGVITEIPPQGDKRRAYAGRVFVTDAVLEEGQTDFWLSPNPITPKILATPKPTAFQHYLIQQEPDDKNKLDHYDSPPPHNTVIRGHKRYWHQGLSTDRGLTLSEIEEHIEETNEIPSNSTQHTQFRPVKPGVRFKFRIYFENLSERELGALCWTLHPLGNPGKTYCHHLGMGKPLGMGAVKLEATLYLTNRPTRYSSLFDGDNWQMGITGPGKSLSDRKTLESLTRAFEQHILDAIGLGTRCNHLYEVKRIGMLLKLMEWPGYPADLKGDRYLRNQNRPNKRYMTIQPTNEYRDRPVLPDPSAFDPKIQNLAEP
jgi:CRISPR-associated protein (TIGR03986 family)